MFATREWYIQEGKMEEYDKAREWAIKE